MAFQQNMLTMSAQASADLTAKQFHFVEVNSSGQLAAAGDGAHADGVLQDTPNAAGRAGLVAIGGVTKVACGGVVTRGGPVASDAAGKAVNAAANDIILGTALETGANGSIIAMIFNPRGASA